MRMSTVLNKMLGVQGLWVRGVRLRVEEKALWLLVVPRWRISRCGTCGRKVRRRHDRTWRSWRHLDVLGWPTYLRYAIWRVKCPQCGVRTEQVPWAVVGSRFTRDFERQVAWLTQRCDLTAVAEHFGVFWATVRNIVHRVVEQEWDAVLRKKAPQARVIFDRFHIVRHLNEAVTKVRQQLVREADPMVRRDLKNTRFPVLKLPHSRTPKDRRVLKEQVRGNRKLYRAMLLKDDFMGLYTHCREGWARRFLEGWLHRAMYSKLEPIKKVARMIRNHLDGVVGWVQWQISNGRLEGMNNRIRRLSHRSFGLHSAETLISLVYLCCGGLTLETVHTK